MKRNRKRLHKGQRTWLTAKQAAAYLGFTYMAFRRKIIPQMQSMGISGMYKSGPNRSNRWRFSTDALDRYVWLLENEYERAVVQKRNDVVMAKAQILDVSRKSARPFK